MHSFAKQIARTFKGGEILLLQGPLGSGKTTFVKALARALRIKKNVVSPTFTLCHAYELPKKKTTPNPSLLRRGIPSPYQGGVRRGLIHIDCYRLKTPEEFLHLGALEQIGAPDTITVIEWPEKIKKFLPRQGRILLQFGYANKDGERIVISNR